MRRVLALAALLALSGCAEENAAKDAVRAQLLDPRSAQFEDVRVHESDDGKAVCGRVNAKNKLGGYVGFKRFFVRDGKLTMEPADVLALNNVELATQGYGAATFDLRFSAACVYSKTYGARPTSG